MHRLNELPDLDAIVTDYKMPRMDGAELARRIGEIRPEIPVLLITGYTGVRDDFVSLPRLDKPFGQMEIAHALQSLLDARDNIVKFPRRG